MKKLLLKMVASLGLVALVGVANASDIKAGDTVIKNYDNYRLNVETHVCEKTKNDFKNRLMIDLETGLVTIVNVYQNAVGTMTNLVAADKSESVQIYVMDNYGECEFSKAVMTHKAGAGDAHKFIGLKDPKIK